MNGNEDAPNSRCDESVVKLNVIDPIYDVSTTILNTCKAVARSLDIIDSRVLIQSWVFRILKQ